MTHTEQGFLDDICAHPGRDDVRLIYADWLEEHADDPCPKCSGDGLLRRWSGKALVPSPGEPCLVCAGTRVEVIGRAERGEFIRVQMELAKQPEQEYYTIGCLFGTGDYADYPAGRCCRCDKEEKRCQYHALREREQELLGDYGQFWLPEPPEGHHCFYNTFPQHPRFPEEGGWAPDEGEVTARTCVMMEFRRGFVEVVRASGDKVKMALNHLHGVCPLREVVITSLSGLDITGESRWKDLAFRAELTLPDTETFTSTPSAFFSPPSGAK